MYACASESQTEENIIPWSITQAGVYHFNLIDPPVFIAISHVYTLQSTGEQYNMVIWDDTQQLSSLIWWIMRHKIAMYHHAKLFYSPIEHETL